VNRIQQAGSLDQYISISIKGSSVTYFIEIYHMTGTWLHDVTHAPAFDSATAVYCFKLKYT